MHDTRLGIFNFAFQETADFYPFYFCKILTKKYILYMHDMKLGIFNFLLFKNGRFYPFTFANFNNEDHIVYA
jgi:hypothetical protein